MVGITDVASAGGRHRCRVGRRSTMRRLVRSGGTP